MACTDGKNTYLNIKELPVINDIVPGDFMIIETPSSTSIIDFQNFLITLDNTTFGDLIVKNTNDIADLNSSIERIDETINNLEIDIEDVVSTTISTIPLSTTNLYYNNGTLSRRNKLINGNFNIWQRGTTATYPVSSPTDYMLADRWICQTTIPNNNDNGQATVRRMIAGKDEIPYFNSNFYLRKIHDRVNINTGRTVIYNLSTSATGLLAIQQIEDVRQILGKEVTLSFWARTHEGSKDVQILSESQIHSTEGGMSTPTIHKLITITSNWQKYTHTYTMPTYQQVLSAAYNPAQIQNKFTDEQIVYPPLGTSIPPLSSWLYQLDLKDFWSLSDAIDHGNSDGRPKDYPGAAMTASELSAFTNNAISTGYYDIAEIQLEEGPVATPFEFRSPVEELALCHRYYYKSYDTDVAPGTLNATGILNTNEPISASSGTIHNSLGIFPTEMFKVPSIRIYHPYTVGLSAGPYGNCYIDPATSNSSNFVINSVNASKKRISTMVGSISGTVIEPVGNLRTASWHFTADAEIY